MNGILKHIPNTLSVLRILFTPVIFYLIVYFREALFIPLLVLYTSTVFLDFLDGYIARTFHVTSETGKILDPLADKLLVTAVIVGLLMRTDFPLWLAILIILRDLFILSSSLLLYRGRGKIKASILVGKVTFGLLSLMTYFYIVDLYPRFDLLMIKRFFVVTSTVFLLWSCSAYMKVFLQELKNREKADE